MAWTAPKVDWGSEDGIGYADLTAIGENLLYLKEQHADLSTGVHGAVSAATPNTILARDADGRAKVADPSAVDDIATLGTVNAEGVARAAADTSLNNLITALGTDKVAKAGDTMTGDLVGDFPDTGYTTAKFRNIKLMTSIPAVGDLNNGEIAMVYEV